MKLLRKGSEEMNNYLVEQLKNGRTAKKLKQSDVAKMIGVKGNTLSNYENGISEPDIDTFCALCDIYDLDPAEVLGEAYGLNVQGSNFNIKPSEIKHIEKYRDLDDHGRDMVDTILNKETKRIEKFGKLGENNIVTLIEYESHRDPTYLIPYFEGGVSAGNGIYQLNDAGTTMMTLWETELTKQADFIIRVSGSSMEPDYHDGERVLVDRKVNVELGEVGIFVKNGETFIKEMGNGELISRNPEYQNISVHDFDNVVCLGKVIGTLNDTMIAKD